MSPLLERLALHRPELRAWALYDWANSAFMTTVIAAVFPIYFSTVAARGLPAHEATFRFGIATTIALATVAVMAPVLGAIADYSAAKKRMLLGFQMVGVVAAAAMWFIGPGDWLLALALFMLGNIGVSGAFTFYDSLLPHIASNEEMDRVSTTGYAIGYLGGGLLLAINLTWILMPEVFGLRDADVAVRLSFVSVAIWWLVFSLPLLRQVPEPRRVLEADERPDQNPVAVGFTRLRETLRDLRLYRQAFLMLIAFLIYNDGINTIIRMATIFGTEIGIGREHLITALLLVQFVGVPCSFLFGRIAAWMGAKNAVFLSLAIYTGISILGYFMQTAAHFYALALLVGTVQGGSQALSRSLFATMVPRHKSSEFFGFFGVFEKFASIFGPFLFAMAASLTGSSRSAVLSVILFFVAGALVLSRVDVGEGQRVARDAEAHMTGLGNQSLRTDTGSHR
ncbi:MAG: MFS transporter [Luteitalea sp.]|nr:MFS transporter [Luteitalea sp.]